MEHLAQDPATSSGQELSYITHGKVDKPTVVFIHGAFGDAHEWDSVASRLSQDFHLLVPDLPRHGGSKDIKPFSVHLSAKLIASLILAHANQKKAHVVGLSLGSKVAMELACKYPQVVSTVFISGYSAQIVPTTLPPGVVSRGFWAMTRVENAMPRSLVRWLMDGTDMPRLSECPSLALTSEITGDSSTDHAWPDKFWGARTLVVAAGKSGILPTSDSFDHARKLAAIGNSESERGESVIAVMHPLMRHPWHLQDPELFARAVRAWIEESQTLEGFVKL